MIKKGKQSNETEKSTFRGRNWNLMLVDDHGRIIPIKRFKGIVLMVICLLFFFILVLAASGYFYMRQSSRIDRLSSELTEMQEQAASLRDEKDVLIAQLVTSGTLKKTENKPPENVKNNLPATPQSDQQPALRTPDDQPDVSASTLPVLASPVPVPEKSQAPKPVKIKWGAKIQNFDAGYESNRSAIKAAFQLHNASSPKEKLSGHVVVVFKNSKKAPPQWIAVPQVDLVDGVPDGKNGKHFRINNYMTIQFRAYDQQPPVVFDSATVYIFSEGAQLINSEDFDLDINIQPIAKSGAKEPAASESDSQSIQPSREKNLPTEKIERLDAAEHIITEQDQQITPTEHQFVPKRNSDLPEASEKPTEPGPEQKSSTDPQDVNQSGIATTITEGEPQ